MVVGIRRLNWMHLPCDWNKVKTPTVVEYEDRVHEVNKTKTFRKVVKV